eukprot:scaffold808_cov370-Prasinococcus_capsulatus_cf.AAC.12
MSKIVPAPPTYAKHAVMAGRMKGAGGRRAHAKPITSWAHGICIALRRFSLDVGNETPIPAHSVIQEAAAAVAAGASLPAEARGKEGRDSQGVENHEGA